MDVLEQKTFMSEGIRISEKLFPFHRYFTSAVTPENGIYGSQRKDGDGTSFHSILPGRKTYNEKGKPWQSSTVENKL